MFLISLLGTRFFLHFLTPVFEEILSIELDVGWIKEDGGNKKA